MSDLHASMLATLSHIKRVQELLAEVAGELVQRGIRHDGSKLCAPEVGVFAECTAKLSELTYGSDEYRQCLADMGPALEHHYLMNRHHPEHWGNGIADMSLIDLIEMLCDWKAATERHGNGCIVKSLEINQKRFSYGDELASILRQTVLLMWPSHRVPWHCFGCGAGGMQGNFCEMCGAGKNDYEPAGGGE